MIATIVIPTYNQRVEYLAAAVNSAVAQTVPVEIVIVDDGSDKPVPTKGCPSNVKVLRHDTNKGIATALNTGIQAASTDWLCWLSSDDMIDPNKVECQLEHTIRANVRCSYHPYRVIMRDQLAGESYLSRWTTMYQQRLQLANMCDINGSTTMIHRDVFNAVGPYDVEYKYGQDWEMWNRIGQHYLWHAVPILLGTRREGGNLTSHIADDPALRKVRDAEDAKIRARYRVVE